jgi:hypothetical protein
MVCSRGELRTLTVKRIIGFMETMDEIEAQLRNLPEGVDPIKAAASEIHRERRAHAGTQSQLARTQGELAQCSVTVGKFNEQAIQQRDA